jgi:hypothetical protein
MSSQLERVISNLPALWYVEYSSIVYPQTPKKKLSPWLCKQPKKSNHKTLRACENCGAPVPRGNKKPRRFCGQHCYWLWRRRNAKKKISC